MSDPATPPVEPTPPTPPAPPVPNPADEYAEQLANMRAENARLKAEKEQAVEDKKAAELAAHKNRKNWEEVASIKEKEADEYKNKYSNLSKAMINNEKLKAVTEEAVKAGLNPVALPDLEMFDFPEISVETTNTGRITVSGTAQAIQRLKTSRPHWFTVNAPTVNSNSPTTHSAGPIAGAVTLAQVEELEAKWSKDRSPTNEAAYKAAVLKYKSQ